MDSTQGRLQVAVVHVCGQCLSGKITNTAGTTSALPDSLHDDLTAAMHGDGRSASEIADVSARLAEFEAETVRRFLRTAPAVAGTDAEPLLIAVNDPCVRNAAGRPWQSVLPLGDPARLAELTGLNVLDACEARHVAAGSEAALFDSVALWLLLHSARRDRIYLEIGAALRVVVLPAGCEPSAAGRIAVRTIESDSATAVTRGNETAARVVEVLKRLVPQAPNPLQLFVRGGADEASSLAQAITRIAPFTEPLDWRHLRVSLTWLDAAIAAAMGHLFLDHLPQAPDATDLTHGPRLLGRLTPGSILNWRRLLEYATASLPENVPLRAAV